MVERLAGEVADLVGSWLPRIEDRSLHSVIRYLVVDLIGALGLRTEWMPSQCSSLIQVYDAHASMLLGLVLTDTVGILRPPLPIRRIRAEGDGIWQAGSAVHTEEHAAHVANLLHTRGWAVMESVVNEDMLVELDRVLSLRKALGDAIIPELRALSACDEAGSVFWLDQYLLETEPAMQALLTDAVLISVAQQFFRSQALQRLQPPSSAVAAAYLLRLRN